MISNQEREEVAKRWKASTAQIYRQEADDTRSITSKHAARNTIRSGIFLQELLKRRIMTVEKVVEMRTDAWIRTLSKRTKPIPPEDKREVVEDVKQIISSRCETVERAVMEKAKQILGRKSDQLEGWKRQVEQECSRLLARFKSEVECRIMGLDRSIQEKRKWKRTEKISLASAAASIIATAVSIISLILSLKAFHK